MQPFGTWLLTTSRTRSVLWVHLHLEGIRSSLFAKAAVHSLGITKLVCEAWFVADFLGAQPGTRMKAMDTHAESDEVLESAFGAGIPGAMVCVHV